MADDRDAIMSVLKGVEAAFSALDIDGWLDHFHSRFLLMSPQTAVVPASRAEAAMLVQPLIEGLRARGFARSEMQQATVKLLSPSTALAAVEWVRRNRDREEIDRIGTTYAFFRAGDSWKIVMVTVHPPETLVRLV